MKIELTKNTIKEVTIDKIEVGQTFIHTSMTIKTEIRRLDCWSKSIVKSNIVSV